MFCSTPPSPRGPGGHTQAELDSPGSASRTAGAALSRLQKSFLTPTSTRPSPAPARTLMDKTSCRGLSPSLHPEVGAGAEEGRWAPGVEGPCQRRAVESRSEQAVAGRALWKPSWRRGGAGARCSGSQNNWALRHPHEGRDPVIRPRGARLRPQTLARDWHWPRLCEVGVPPALLTPRGAAFTGPAPSQAFLLFPRRLLPPPQLQRPSSAPCSLTHAPKSPLSPALSPLSNPAGFFLCLFILCLPPGRSALPGGRRLPRSALCPDPARGLADPSLRTGCFQ